MWGIVPAAGAGTRMQPLAFSKELLPVGSRLDAGFERPRAVSEYLVDRLVAGGATKLCIVISPGKSDILGYFGGSYAGVPICYVVQPEPLGLCDAIFRALPIVADDELVLVGLPDTVWFPEDGLRHLGDEPLSFLLFPVDRPEAFDAVLTGAGGEVRAIRVKEADPGTHWVWGAFKLRGSTMRELHALFCRPERRDPYVGTLVNAWLALGGRATAVRAGRHYHDVGTVGGYREAVRLLGAKRRPSDASEHAGSGGPR